MRRPAPSRAEDLTVVLAECRARRPAAGSASQLARYLGSGSYVEAVLGVGACLADGLAHAHERGILHRDLKPANVLLTDEGVPMLLDFNLSEDTKQPHTTSAGSMGGTLPYVAPEHLEAFAGKPRTLDGRADVYALGVILFELLTLRHPFDLLRGPVEEILPSMLAQRQGAPPRLRTICPAIPAAVESLVRHCLEPDPNRRYASARELQEDLERQRNNEPLRHIPEPSLRERLRKWGRRHPRLISSGSVAAMAGVGLLLLALLLMVRNQKLTRLEAAQAAEQLRSEVRTVQFLLLDNRAGSSGPLDEGLARCQQLLDQFDIRGNPRWQDRAFFRALTPEQRAQLLGEIGDLLLLGSRVLLLQAAHPARASEREQFLQDALVLNERAEQCHPVGQAPRAVWRQRIELLRAQGRFEEARECAAQLPEGPATTARDLAAEAAEISFNGRPDEALPLLLEAVRSDPRDLWAWFDLGLCQEGLGHDAEAAACFSTCIALAPDFWPLAYKRGIVHLRRREFSLACADLDRVVEAQPEMVEARINRALALVGAGRSSDAERDLTAALEREQPPTRLFFLRARVREQQGDLEGAARDRAEGLRRQPGDEASWLARGTARLAADPAGALADFDQALVLNPRSLPALQNRAHVLAECLEQPRSAIETLDRILQLHPANLPARASRAVLLARLAERSAAHRDAEACLARDTQPETLYQIAGVYALTSILHSDDRWDALHCLGLALRRGYGLDLIDRDRDLDPIRRLPEFQQLVDQARRVRARPENPSARP
jgi:tetratricopeptide (TPR) repeat protein